MRTFAHILESSLKMPEQVHDPVSHPQHYTFGKIEVIDAIEDWKLGFHLGNCIKYIVRADHKGNCLEDLKKSRWYLTRRIEQLEKLDTEKKAELEKQRCPVTSDKWTREVKVYGGVAVISYQCKPEKVMAEAHFKKAPEKKEFQVHGIKIKPKGKKKVNASR